MLNTFFPLPPPTYLRVPGQLGHEQVDLLVDQVAQQFGLQRGDRVEELVPLRLHRQLVQPAVLVQQQDLADLKRPTEKIVK